MRTDGVSEYTSFWLKISMPEGKEACKYCPCIKFDNDSNTRRCKRTWELLAYPDTSRGALCPLIKEENNTEDYYDESDYRNETQA